MSSLDIIPCDTCGCSQVNVPHELMRGRMISLPCDTCGWSNAVDNTNELSPLIDVTWICVNHHKTWHKNKQKGLN
jgi:uncharacterized Zn finger protein